MSCSWLSPPVVNRAKTPKRCVRQPQRRSTRCLPVASSGLAKGEDGASVNDGDEEEDGTKTGKFSLRGRFNASPKSVYRALTEYENVQHMSHSIVSCKRLWISSRIGRTLLRLQSRDRNLLWGTMKGDFVVEVVEDVQGGKVSFRAENVDDRAAFSVQGTWNINPVVDAKYLCDVGLELEVRPLRFAVDTSSLRRWTSAQLPAVVQQVVARSMELDQVRLRAPRFLPALEATFGARFEFDGWSGEKRSTVGGPRGYLGLSELPLPLRDDGRDDERGAGGRFTSGRPDSTTTSQVPKVATMANAQTVRNSTDQGAGKTNGEEGEAAVGKVGSAQVAERWFIEDDSNLTLPGASEVHMRRFDTETTLHRRALGAVRIQAPPDVVYRILTHFEGMPKFVPNLAFTEQIEVPFSLRNRPGRMRLRQVFLKCQLYHFLEAGVTLDMVKKDDKGEVQFRILDTGAPGEILQGKWLVVPCPDDDEVDTSKAGFGTSKPTRMEVGTDMKNSVEDFGNDEYSAESVSGSIAETRIRSRRQATILKFAIEGRALRRQSSRGFWLNSDPMAASAARDSPLPERAVFEEILLMLHSAREHMESTFELEQRATSIYTSESTLRPEGMIDPLSSLRSQLLKLGFGADGLMPRRAELRSLGAYDIEQAVVAAGGFEKVAEQLGWTSNRKKPRGYWSDLVNVEREVLSFIEENRLEPGVMPSRPQLEELGRKDIARSLAKHGGAGVIAGKIGLMPRRYRPRRTRPKV